MRLSKITVSGANEFTDAQALVSLCEKHCLSEIGIQVSGDKAYFSSARYWWIWALCSLASRHVQIALHLNKDWAEDFCDGKIPTEVQTLLHNFPTIRTIQLNFKIGREKTPDLDTLLDTMKRCYPRNFVLSYNDSNKEFINRLHDTGFKFACLYDNSFGEGITPDTRPAPAFPDIYQGYAGGLSPDNIADELDKIRKVIPSHCDFFIDAEGKLKGDDGHFSLEKCKQFLDRAVEWAYRDSVFNR